MLNGFAAYGCDLNPLAAKIAGAKTGILCVPRDVTDSAIRSLLECVSRKRSFIPGDLDQFSELTHGELQNWFPKPVLYKLNWLLSQVRLFGNPAILDFLEVLVSSIIRDISQQDPTDLRIRRRKEQLEDAPVFEMFQKRLEHQHNRLLKYWSIEGRQPGSMIQAVIKQGDSRYTETIQDLSLGTEMIDAVVTSPPYATALPYIDTDRLSLLAVMGLTSSVRSYFETNLTGSREIRRTAKEELEDELHDRKAIDRLPENVVNSIRDIYAANKSVHVGFRRANMAALLWRYFSHMRDNLSQVSQVLKPGAKAFYVVGDSRTKAGGSWTTIETCKHIAAIGQMLGLDPKSMLPIDVTTENYKHIRNAITQNQIIRL